MWPIMSPHWSCGSCVIVSNYILHYMYNLHILPRKFPANCSPSVESAFNLYRDSIKLPSSCQEEFILFFQCSLNLMFINQLSRGLDMRRFNGLRSVIRSPRYEAHYFRVKNIYLFCFHVHTVYLGEEPVCE